MNELYLLFTLPIPDFIYIGSWGIPKVINIAYSVCTYGYLS